MTAQELRDKYNSLYAYMAASRDPENMKLFGRVMSEMMEWMIVNKADVAEQWIEKLCAIKWDNYLTTAEAEKIVSEMRPAAPWSRSVWRDAMDSLELAKEHEPHYNSCALWVVMNMVYSDSAETIAKLMGGTIDDVDSAEMVKAVHAFAVDKLTDEDGRFDVRHYFGLS